MVHSDTKKVGRHQFINNLLTNFVQLVGTNYGPHVTVNQFLIKFCRLVILVLNPKTKADENIESGGHVCKMAPGLTTPSLGRPRRGSLAQCTGSVS